ncbi:MAG: hypothetical protein RSE98_00740 [Anaerovoracaceae bacterium]
MNAKELRDWIDSLISDIEFEYQGVFGSICPFAKDNISVSYGDDEQTFQSIDDVMVSTIVDGMPIKDICQNFYFGEDGI